LIALLARLRRITTGQWMALELAFATKALRDICESEATAKEKLGAKVADALKRRLSDFRSTFACLNMLTMSDDSWEHFAEQIVQSVCDQMLHLFALKPWRDKEVKKEAPNKWGLS
jgi:hypothetical protein